MNEIEELFKAQRELKERVLLNSGVKTHKFGRQIYFVGMDFGDMKEGELLLSHAYLHKSFSMKEPVLPKSDLQILHKDIVQELNKRDLSHTSFDDLDQYQ